MSDSSLDWWAGSGVDRTQNRKISQLQDELANVHSWSRVQQRRLHSELSKVRGTLEQRLDRITASFDAFVELSDVRMLLIPFADYGLVRHQAHRLLEGSATSVLGQAGDTPDYWLAPAVKGLRAALNGDTGTAQRHFAESAQYDPTRGGVFALLSTATAGEVPDPDRAAPFADWILPSLLTELPQEVTRYERALWLLAADGLLGPGAREHVHRLALSAVELHPRAGQSASAWRNVKARRSARRQGGLSGVEDITNLLNAADQLAFLRSRLEESIQSAESTEADHYSVETLQLLVEEGGPEEAPLIHRIRQLRQVVESSGESSSDAHVPSWDEPAGDLLDLLLADATEDTPSARRAFAMSVLTPQILADATSLAEQTKVPIDDKVFFTHRRNQIAISQHGADQADLAEAERAITASHDSAPTMVRPIWAGGIALGLSILALLPLATPLFLFLAVIAGLVCVWLIISIRRTSSDWKVALESDQQRLRTQADRAVLQWRELHSEATQAASSSAQDLDSIRALLSRI